MDATVVVGGLVSAIGLMWALFAFILKDERARNDRLTTRLEEQNKTVADAVRIIDTAVGAVGNMREDRRQFYEAIDKLNAAAERFDRRQQRGGMGGSGGER